MTRFDPSLFVKRLVILRTGTRVYDETFHLGVNIIRGEKNSVGKSTIANAIFYALGGEGVVWVDEALLCESVIVEVSINGVAVTLQRDISDSKERPVRIFWGAFDAAEISDPTAWQVFPFAARGASQSFSQVLFRALGIPEVRGELAARLTMHQLLRLMFADQLTPPIEMFRQEQFNFKETLDAVGSLLCGVYDDRIYEISSEMRQRQTEKDEITGQLSVLWKVLQTSDQSEGLLRLSQQVEEREQQRKVIYATIEEMRAGRWTSGDDIKSKKLQSLATEIENVNRQATTAERELSNLSFEIDDSAQFLAALNDNGGALSDSSATRAALGEILFGYCPACFNDIAQEAQGGTCALCKSPIEKKTAEARLLRIRQELSLQLEESSKLQEARIKRRGELLIALPTLKAKQKTLALQYNDLAGSVTSIKEDAIAQAYEQLGYISREIENLRQQLELAKSLDAIENRKSVLVGELSRLSDEHDRRVASRDAKQSEAYGSIREVVSYVLNHDEDLESEFAKATPDDIQFSFKNNVITAFGRKNFSASSMVVLKNAFHLALVIASTRKSFFRYPRFALFDSIEDKGMTNSRSHIFQRMIVELSETAETEHQIIFTTSMIDPSLDSPKYTVGDFYTRTHKSLRIHSGLN